MRDCGKHGPAQQVKCQNLAVATSWEWVGRLAAGAIALAAGLGTLALSNGGIGTTYMEKSAETEAIFVAAGLGLVLAGMAGSFSRPGWRIADLAVIAGFLWFAPAWVGWHVGSPMVRSMGMIAAAFVFPVIAHLVLAFPSGRMHPRAVRVVVTIGYVGAELFVLGSALFWDPFFDTGCWANCTDNVFLVRSLPAFAHAIQVAGLWFLIAFASAVAAICTWRIINNSGQARRVLAPVIVPGMLVAAAVIAHSIAVLRVPVEDPSDPVFYEIFLTGCVSAFLLAAGLVFDMLRTLAQRLSVARIVASLDEAPAAGSLESALAHAVGDPELRIAYWVSDPGRYVDAAGRPVPDPVAAPGQTLTTLVRDGRRLAVVSHTTAVPDLEREMGAAVRLGLENERLQAESLSRLEELRASRARIVETEDTERRRLERDLHDGAQQRMLALSYEIRLARASANAGGDARIETQLEGAVEECQAALDELRELAHGIYPAILAEAGLGPALATLADAAPVPVEIRDADAGRYSPPVEMAAYLLASDSIYDAARRGARHASVITVRDDDRLVITVEDDGRGRDGALDRLVDRVGALGGTLEFEARKVRGELPCG